MHVRRVRSGPVVAAVLQDDSELTAEQALWLAVIRQAMNFLEKPSGARLATSVRPKILWEETRDWFKDGGFQAVCELCGWDAEEILRQLQQSGTFRSPFDLADSPTPP